MEIGFAKVNLSLFLEAMGWREQKEGSKQDGAWGGVVCPKPRGGKVPPGSVLIPSPSTWGCCLPAGSQHPSRSRFPYLVLRSSDPVWFPRSCHGNAM